MIVNMASQCLRKPIALPSLNKYHVHQDDLLANDDLLSFTKAKGFLFNHVSPMESRRICLTRNGQLVIYKKPSEGYILNVRKADSVTVVSNTFKKNRTISHQCHIKIHFSFGSVNLYVLNDKIGKWRKAISSIFEGKIQDGKREASVQTDMEATPIKTSTTHDHQYETVFENSATVALSPITLRSDGQLARSGSKTSVTSEISDSCNESFVTVIEVPEAQRTKPVTQTTQITTDTSSNDSDKENNDTSDSFDTLLERFDRMSAELDELHSQNQNMQKVEHNSQDSGKTQLLSNDPKKETDSSEAATSKKSGASNAVRRGAVSVASFRKRLESNVSSIFRSRKPAANRPLKQSGYKVRNSIARMGGTITEEQHQSAASPVKKDWAGIAIELLCVLLLLYTCVACFHVSTSNYLPRRQMGSQIAPTHLHHGHFAEIVVPFPDIKLPTKGIEPVPYRSQSAPAVSAFSGYPATAFKPTEHKDLTMGNAVGKSLDEASPLLIEEATNTDDGWELM